MSYDFHEKVKFLIREMCKIYNHYNRVINSPRVKLIFKEQKVMRGMQHETYKSIQHRNCCNPYKRSGSFGRYPKERFKSGCALTKKRRRRLCSNEEEEGRRNLREDLYRIDREE